jgi:hypothetical protein
MAQGIINGVTSGTTKIPAARNEAQAQQYLDQMYNSGTLPDGQPFGPGAYKALSGFVHQYYSPGKTGDLMGALQQMVGGS